jgi:hypothetical protein
MREVTLNWSGPHKILDFVEKEHIKEEFGGYGVYIWVINRTDYDEIKYVGMSSYWPLWWRQSNHIRYFLGGLYKIPEDFCRNNKKWVPDETLPECRKIMLDLDKYVEVLKDSRRYMNAINVYAAKTKKEETKIIERNLIYNLQPLGQNGTKSVPSNMIRIYHKNATWNSDKLTNKIKEFLLV